MPWCSTGCLPAAMRPNPEFHPTRRLVPRPRVNLILYYGVLGARSAWRPGAPAVTPTAPDAGRPAAAGACEPPGADHADTAASRARALQWAALMQRTFGFDVLACPRCAGRLRLVACIEAAGVVRRILCISACRPRCRCRDLPVRPRCWTRSMMYATGTISRASGRHVMRDVGADRPEVCPLGALTVLAPIPGAAVLAPLGHTRAPRLDRRRP